jgi:aryl-alcohol dehydrogenase-like predicted oxidoreductase
MSKLALGTVQFGLPYGISNSRGQVPAAEVAQMLRLAAASGVDVLDTAQAYGSSEEVLGNAMSAEHLDFRIVTKLKRNPSDGTVSIQPSIEKLKQRKVYGLMLHSFEEYIQTPEIYSELVKAKDQGLVEKIGFSVYSPDQVEKLIGADVRFDILQFPYNIFDRRFDALLPRLKEAGVELHVRSIFLQGLLLMEPSALVPYFSSVSGKLSILRGLATGAGITMPQLCLADVKANSFIDRVVVGVASLGELKANLGAFTGAPALAGGLALEIQKCRVDDERIINPAFWKPA